MKFALRLSIIYVSLFVMQINGENYNIPQLTIEALRPKGIRIIMQDDNPNTKFMEFHANINEKITEEDSGTIFDRVSANKNGLWVINDKHVELKEGDELNYWVLVWNDNKTYKRYDLKFKVKELVD